MIGKNKGHVNTATGRNKREVGGMLRNERNRAKNGRSGAIKRWDGKPAESRAGWRRRNKTRRGR